MEAALRLLNGLVMLAAPLALGACLARRLGTPWGLFAAGAAGFLVSQVLHIPFNLAWLNPAIARASLTPGSRFPGELLGPALIGLSASLFEEPARYLVFRLTSRQWRTWAGGLMLGAGHGGLEAMLLGVLVLYAFFQAVAYREADLRAWLPPDRVAVDQANLAAYWGAPAHTALLGAAERLLALCIQLGLSILVLQSLRSGNLLWLGLAIGWHAVVDGAALISLEVWGPWGAEGVIALLALISLGAVFGLRGTSEGAPELQPVPEPDLNDSPLPAPQPHARGTSGAQDAPEPWANSPERLAESRFLEG